MAKTGSKLGIILVESKVISKGQLDEALRIQKKNGKRLGRILVEKQFVSEEELSKALAEQKGLTVLDLNKCQVNPGAVYMVQEDFARQNQVFAFDLKDHQLYLAMANPLDIQVIDDLQVMTGLKIKPYVATESQILSAIDLYYREDEVEKVEEAAREAVEVSSVEEREEEEQDVVRLRAMVKEVPIVRLANRLIAQAVGEKASDVHIECGRDKIGIRYRVDGVLHDILHLPRRIRPALVSRFKIMANMDIAERRVPQSGSSNLIVSGKPIDLRVTTLPTPYGENLSIRILDKSQALLKLDELGLQPDILRKYKKCFQRPYGTILATGPTGCGKTTTLYSTLRVLNKPEEKIVTIEDPIEYRLPGITQVQVNPKAGLDFVNALRAVVRSDPDILMIGEIRDVETAQIAMRSAMTGHLVLSTLHTNDAPGAISRLVDMGVESFFIPSIICVVAQRLTRKLCPHCKEAYELDAETLKKYDFSLEKGKKAKIYRAKGCSKCNETGYHGRTGLFELMMMSEDIARMSIEKRSANEIRSKALEEGMETLKQDGFRKVLDGITSIEEILRVVV